MSRTFDVAVVGATGAVGEVMLEILAERDFPVGEVYPLASERSAGKKVSFKGKYLTVQNLAEFDFSKVQIGLFSAGASISREYAPRAAAAGCVVIDNTSQYRYDDVVTDDKFLSNPSCQYKHNNLPLVSDTSCIRAFIVFYAYAKTIYETFK